ncbi:aminotransferase class V-fold PLP-dependent enzyme [Marisediminicola sp. LYQ134]|uniref:aminotransferase class V-fold PLP-dependent enzyme n=1 Tax=Marisediminicola sp. LYQ134 TaxID=3391061 RepID=UPI003983AE48
MGIPSSDTVDALRADLDLWGAAMHDAARYGDIVERTRAHYARLVGIGADRVAIGSQTSVLASILAQAVPEGAEVVCVDGDFSSIVFPFMQGPGVRVRHVAIADLAESLTDDTWLVAFSHIQSSTGVVADIPAIVAAAAEHDVVTLCDTTQSAGVHPVDASLFDATVCHSYKWLCAPRGAAFLTLTAELQSRLVPVHAGWYAGDDVWRSCYGPTMTLAADARAFDVSPAWPVWVGAEPAIRMFADLDIAEVWAYTSRLGDLACDALGIPRQHQAIVTMADPDGSALAILAAAGIRASGRAGRVRLAFHLWNDESDVEALARALSTSAAGSAGSAGSAAELLAPLPPA